MSSRLLPIAAAACAISCTTPTTETLEAALSRSTAPPAGLAPAQVPQLVAVTFDDNFSAEGMTWATDLLRPLRNPPGSGQAATFDGAPVRTSFFHNSLYLDGTQAAWQVAVTDGHETGDHTVDHPFGLGFDAAQWTPEVQQCRTRLAQGLGLAPQAIAGFRTPYLAYDDALFAVLAAQSFAYDTSIQGGWADGEAGGSGPWPYPLDGGSADASTVVAKFGGGQAQPVGAHPGLWELPVTTLIVPPDSVAAQYGFAPGLRARVQAALAGKSVPSFYEPSSGKVAGLDITLIVDGRMTRAEALATLEYTLDLHLAGNRAPLVFVAHTHVYASGYGAAPSVPDAADRRAILEDFVRYALARPDVRMRPLADVLAWMKQPVALGGGAALPPPDAGVPDARAPDAGIPGGSCSAPAWSASSYAAGDVVTAACQVSTVGTTCYGHVGASYAWRCDNPGWCAVLRPGSDQGGWWSAWTSIHACS
jgi:hypothetical protein